MSGSYSYGGELHHYGVLGMKWGVRKDKGRGGGFGKNTKTGEARLPQQIIDPNDKSWQTKYASLKDDKDRQNAYAVAISYNSHLHGSMGNRNDYLDFVKDLKNGSSKRDPNLDKAFKDSSSKPIDIEKAHGRLMLLASKPNLSKEEREELVALSENMEQLMSYYTSQYVQTESEEEREEREKREEYVKKANEAMKKIFEDEDLMQNLHKYSTIIAEPHTDGTISYVYTNPGGVKTSYSNTDKGLKKLKEAVKHDTNSRYLSTKFGRTREKTVSDSKPVSIKKGDSLKTHRLKSMTEKERQDLNKLIEEAMKKRAGR